MFMTEFIEEHSKIESILFEEASKTCFDMGWFKVTQSARENRIPLYFPDKPNYMLATLEPHAAGNQQAFLVKHF